jgi:Raf kinase inhibitor-like YbhB/YbcL family protein
MKLKLVAAVFLILSMAGIILYAVGKKAPRGNDSGQQKSQAKDATISTNMKLTSSAFENNSDIPAKYSCDGQNVSPPLAISEVPGELKSLALIVDDPDAPAGDWTHWLVWNIEPATTKIDEGATLAGAEIGPNDFGKNNYQGPCPPSGTHRYQFKLYALDTLLNLDTSTKKKELLEAMQGHILDQTVLIGLYKKI